MAHNALRGKFRETHHAPMKLTSTAFEHEGIIPHRFSQFGDNVSPPLEFHDTPAATQSFVLIVEDPDAVRGTFTHWVAFDIDGNVRGFPESHVPVDIRQGRNDAGHAAYAGPKPPNGEHRYFFRLYALDRRLALPNGASRADVERAMHGHVLAAAELMGRYATPLETSSSARRQR